jgi:alpha-ketoglutarate-dependent 2,4-dichlorophenoxyacetate dioxygenase
VSDGALTLTPLHPDFGVEVHGVDMREATPTHLYPALRAAFEEHSLLLFRGQSLDDAAHLRFGALFGPVEDRSYGAMGAAPRMANVSNLRDDGTVAPADDLLTLDLMGNQLWHTDSIFLPLPALANVLAARVLSSTGGETELCSTRAAWRDLPEALRGRVDGAVFRHRLAHSRRDLSPVLVERHRARFPDQAWRSVWVNPVNGRGALYLASHTFAVDDLPPDESQHLVDELIAFCTRPERVYTHRWLPGDVLVWDERATLHRGRPWPYDEERTLASICVSVTDADGVDSVRVGPAE